MDQSIRHFGINFRSNSHFAWAVLSFSVFFIIFTFKVLNADKDFGMAVWIMVLAHLETSVMAAIKTKGGRVNGPEYSVDCIWFNPLMAVLYVGATLLLSAIL